MTEKEVKKLLKKAYEERLFGDGAEAIAILERVHNEFPENITYLGLLATTYYEQEEYDLALECCDKADLLEANNAKILDLRGLIAESKGDKASAKIYYREALAKEPLLVECRLKLINLLFEEKRYEEVVTECQFVLKHNDPDRENYDVKAKKNIFVTYLSIVYHRYWQSLVHLKKYENAISVVQEYIKLRSTAISDPSFFHNEEELLLKLYYLTNNEEGYTQYVDLFKTRYKMSDKFISGVKKDAEAGYILDTNFDNYEIDEKGRFL